MSKAGSGADLDAAAFEAGLRALAVRDHTLASLDARLARRGFDSRTRDGAVERLARAGYVDDDRFARGRAAALARRGSGDGLIRVDLEQHGVSPETVAAALAALEPERERAARVVRNRTGGPRAIRYLAARGFSEEVLEELIAVLDEDALG